MNILILNGSPRQNGNTKKMIEAFTEGAQKNNNEINVIDICKKNISGCLGCEHCHTKGNGVCIQKDDMTEVYEALKSAEMLVVASPIYYFGYTGQLQCAIHRTYATGKPKNLKKTILILSSGSDDVYEGAIYEYKKTFSDYMKVEDAGIYKAYGEKNRSEEFLGELRLAGENI